MVTGLDLVELQIRVARGEELPLKTSDVQKNGHAIECRICAEDSYDNFLPSIGRIFDVSEPGGEHIRVDSSIYPGMEVSLYYDPMISKLICWGTNRDEAIERTLAALDQYHIAGVATTIPFCKAVLKNKEFCSGDFSTGYVKKHWIEPKQEIDKNLMRVAIAAAVRTEKEVWERIDPAKAQRV